MCEDELIEKIKKTLLEWALEEVEENPDSELSLYDRYYEHRDWLFEAIKERL